MPETAQDIFETLNPGLAPITAEILRITRSNSTGSRYNADDENPNVEKRPARVSHLSFTDLDSCIGGPDHIYGYKRRSSHR